MNFNTVVTGIELLGTKIKKLNVENDIVDVETEAKRSLGININEPQYQQSGDELYAQITIDFEINLEQDEGQKCKIEMSIEGAFLSEKDTDVEKFKELVLINGAAALIGIVRGKVESITASIFNNGKIVIPFINVVDYYKNL